MNLGPGRVYVSGDSSECAETTMAPHNEHMVLFWLRYEFFIEGDVAYLYSAGMI